MSTATKLGSAFGACAFAFALMGGPALAVPDGDPAKNDHGQETAAAASERLAEDREDPTTKENGTTATDEDAAPGSADRATEAGHSGTQGRSESNPDAERDDQSGVDKPYDAAGESKFTQWDDSDADGNNGCGNDTNFEDDNNGNCGGKVKATSNEPKPEVKTETVTPRVTEVLGVQMERVEAAPASASVAAAEAAPAQVLGVQLERGAAAAALARTGLPLLLAALVGLALLGGGAFLRRLGKS